ncbi:MAG: hypothetical protein KJ583_01085 [Nanoarchaeota archaeon]|nr:hypothetical protein [Nanoarchaeota archaeon]MBU1269494.1 hypothetical protein [Nanoarchaeota archaeon]MBU1603885.1 hypothetical protein [Nanoarchaeota archaeon]MBU2443343.1 hypothetical protein [Nanoarchaeota archaeon]
MVGEKKLDKRGVESPRRIIGSSSDSNELKKSLNHEKILLGVLFLIIIAGLVGFFMIRPPAVQEDAPEPPLSDFDELRLAVESGNLSMCEALTPVKKTICKDTILGASSEMVSPLQESAGIIRMASELKDSSLCDEILDSAAKQLCVYESTKKLILQMDGYYVDEETNTVKATQYQEVENIISEASATKNSNLCNEILNPVKRDLCFFESSKSK